MLYEVITTVSSFLISDRSHNYYYGGGVLKRVSEREPRDKSYNFV